MRPGRVAAEVKRRPAAVELMTHPGVGPVMTALAMVLTLGPAERFSSARQVASYFGLIPREHSRGGRQWLGHISKQGSPFLRFLRVKAGQSAARYDAVLADSIAGWRCLSIADWRSAGARKLAVRLQLMLRQDWSYAPLCRAVGRRARVILWS